MHDSVYGVSIIERRRSRVAGDFVKNRYLNGIPGLIFNDKTKRIYQDVRVIDTAFVMALVRGYASEHWVSKGVMELADYDIFEQLCLKVLQHESGSSYVNGFNFDITNLNGGVIGALQYQPARLLDDLRACKDMIRISDQEMDLLSSYAKGTFLSNRQFISYVLKGDIGENGLLNPALQPLVFIASNYRVWRSLPEQVRARVKHIGEFLYGNHVNPRAFKGMVKRLAKGDSGILYVLKSTERDRNPTVEKRINESYV